MCMLSPLAKCRMSCASACVAYLSDGVDAVPTRYYFIFSYFRTVRCCPINKVLCVVGTLANKNFSVLFLAAAVVVAGLDIVFVSIFQFGRNQKLVM